MKVSCPNCETKYNLPDDRIAPGGTKVKCSKCKHVFAVTPPPATPEEEVEMLLEEPKQEAAQKAGEKPDFDAAFEEAVAGGAKAEQEEKGGAEAGGQAPAEESAPAGEEAPAEESAEAPAGGEEEEQKLVAEAAAEGGDLFKSLEEEGGQTSEEGPLSFGVEEEKKGRKGLGCLIVILAVVLVAGSAIATYHFKMWRLPASWPALTLPFKLPVHIPFIKGPETADKAKPGESPSERVKNIALKNVRQYYVTNEKAGPIFVVEGKAVNTFQTPKERIKVEASLYDERSNVLASKQQLCGNTLSLFQLQVQTEEEINAALNSDVGVLSSNTFLKPGADTPFMLVFFRPPEAVKEFGVKVVDVRDPE